MIWGVASLVWPPKLGGFQRWLGNSFDLDLTSQMGIVAGHFWISLQSTGSCLFKCRSLLLFLGGGGRGASAGSWGPAPARAREPPCLLLDDSSLPGLTNLPHCRLASGGNVRKALPSRPHKEVLQFGFRSNFPSKFLLRRDKILDIFLGGKKKKP